MPYTRDNFVRSTLQADISADATTITLATAAAPLRDPPDATPDAPGLVILQDAPESPTKIEIVTYTGRSIAGSIVTLTGCVRGCENGTAAAWTAGAPTFAGLTAGVVNDLQTQVRAKVAGAGLATTLWAGTQAEFDALPTATTNDAGFIGIVRG